MAPVEYSIVDTVARITLNRPDAANAFDLDSTRQFAAAVRAAAADEQVRSVVISGSGPRFCAGGDVASFARAEDQSAHLHQLATELDVAFRDLAAMPKPVAAAVHGAVAGAGLALMLSCDVIIAAPTTRFVFAYPTIGLTPDCGLSYLLPRAIGQQRALAFALLDGAIGASEALSWGLVSHVVVNPVEKATHIATTWTMTAPTALGHTRRLLREASDVGRLATGVEEARTIAKAVTGPEARALVATFMQR